MIKLRSIVLGLGLSVMAASTANAATPAEQAAFREQAKQLTEQARALEGQADAARETAKNNYLFAIKSADGLEDQADAKKVQALQKWLQAGDNKMSRAMALREHARGIMSNVFNLTVRAAMTDESAANERARAKQERAAAAALIAAGDAESKQVAKELNNQADEDDKDGKELENDAKRMRARADLQKKAADALIAAAVKLETAPTPAPKK